MARLFTLAVCSLLLNAACASTANAPGTVRRDRYTLPLGAKDSDLFCIEPQIKESAVLLCRPVGELRDFMWSQKAAVYVPGPDRVGAYP